MHRFRLASESAHPRQYEWNTGQHGQALITPGLAAIGIRRMVITLGIRVTGPGRLTLALTGSGRVARMASSMMDIGPVHTAA